MYSRLIIGIFIFLVLLDPLNNILKNYKNGKDSLGKFNNIMVNIEKNLERENFKEVCIDSKTLVKLIENDIEELIKFEPKYNWIEMKSLMEKISSQLCTHST